MLEDDEQFDDEKKKKQQPLTFAIESVSHQRLHFGLVDIFELIGRMGLFDDVDHLLDYFRLVMMVEVFLQGVFQIVVISELARFLFL